MEPVLCKDKMKNVLEVQTVVNQHAVNTFLLKEANLKNKTFCNFVSV